MTTYEPPAEAVEAVAKAIHANDFERGLVAEDVWGDLTDETREWYVANATAALTAAGPLIAAVKDVLELHQPYPVPQKMIYGTITACSECGSVDDAPVEWPCPTVQALTKRIGHG